MFSQLTSYGFGSNGGGSSPGGSASPPDQAIQFNTGGAFDGDSNFKWDRGVRKLMIGNYTVAATATPNAIDMGATIGNNTPGNAGNVKFRLYNDNSGSVYGIGISSGVMEYQAGADSSHVFYVNGVERMRLTSAGNLSLPGNSATPGSHYALVNNTNANGDSRFVAQNDTNGQLVVQMAGSAYALPSLFNAAQFLAQGTVSKMVFATNAELSSGGTSPIIFQVGGYDEAAAEQFRLTSTGAVVKNQLTSSGHTFMADSIDIGVNYGDANVAFSLQSSKNYIFNMYGAGASTKMSLGQNGRLGIGTGTPNANIHVKNYAANNIGQIVQGFAAQSVNLSEWWNSANVANTWIDADGKMFIAGEAPDAAIWKLQVGRSGEAGRVKFIGNDDYGIMIQNGSGKGYVGANVSGNIVFSTSTGTSFFQSGIEGTVIAQPSNSKSALRAGALEFASYAVNNSFMMENMYYDNALPGYVLRNTGYGGLFQFFNGGFTYTGASSGGAGTPAVLTPALFSIDGPGATSGRTRIEGQTGIGVTPAASAKLQVESTTQGFAPPRMTTTQKNAIPSPMEGLLVYDITLHQMSYYNGTVWVNF